MNKPLTGATVDYGPQAAAMQAYLQQGEQRAFGLGNRGPIRFTADGKLHPDILDAYWRCGFYVFESVLRAEELADIERDLQDILDHLPVERGAKLDAKGRPALGADNKAPTLFWSKPLGDPFGGTSLAGGRHPVKMFEPKPATDAPKEVVYLILGSLQFSEAALRVYGHPQLLAVAAAVNGDDFVPFNEALFIKEPGRGASVAWHQDGVTHWDSPDWDQGSHGFNFMAQLYGCTPANGVWVVPGLAQAGQGRHQGDGRRSRHRAAARRGAAGLQAGRRRHHQPPDRARLLRQHQRRLAGDGEFRLPPPPVRARRDGRRACTTPRRCMTPRGSTSAPA